MDHSHDVRIIVAHPFAVFATGLAALYYGGFDHFQAGFTAGVMANEVTRLLAAAVAFDPVDRRTIFFIRACCVGCYCAFMEDLPGWDMEMP